ncbi:hypothetical protein [Alicyclobacillus dauci]|uniref:Uncharacterized protein n=1 Tax=Alicyclobacillus dauci TaxID=1475485 RepID=A0ABY6Z5Q0_9BACL|nr:hypothetical protein [Alicyclobacillus dauci]WAH38209.1 hypothetical protein NZD86_06915 [Alicyclobacillus dauci]
MHLREIEVKRFYHTWLGLLEFTNRKHNIVPELKITRDPKVLNPQQLLPIKDKLWEDESVIDEYLKQNEKIFDATERDTIISWKRRVSGKFIIMKHLKNYTVFMHAEEGGKLYGVTGISNLIEDMFPSPSLPLYAEATLVPFAGRIIYDSLIEPYQIRLGPGIRKNLNNDYRNLKSVHGIVTVL